mgnify:CR=1 FL=1
MTQSTARPKLTVIKGTPPKVDWGHLLEELDTRDAVPILRAMVRQKRPAANSVLALVDAANLVDPQPGSVEQGMIEPV